MLINPVRSAAGGAALLTLSVCFASPWTPAAAADSVQTLVAQAEHNTNTVKTLVHHDVTTVTASGGSLKINAHGAEDEARNREQDFEDVTVTRTSGGKTQKVHYTVDIIFMNGSTYYRTSAAPSQWQTHKGMSFPDPYTGGWKRGRTTVTYPTSWKYTLVGTSGGTRHVRAPFSTKTTAGTVDLWISAGTKPYVIRSEEKYHSTTKQKGSADSLITFGPFDGPVTIQPPAQGST
ncbi:MAG TPA: hypothetical protein VF221_02795 [Chloroflexota bacterium]